MNPKKAPTIKAEIEKLLKAGFIYTVPLTEWVSNLIPVDKKQGAIHICTDFCDLNSGCPKDNFPTPFIDKILDECAGVVRYSPLWTIFPDTIRYNSNPRTNIRMLSFVLGVPLHIGRCPLALKTLEPIFSGL